jgi:galactoside O-acetyltransferase
MTSSSEYLSRDELVNIGLAACGRHVFISKAAAITHPQRLSLGDFVRIDAYSLINSSDSVTIGRNVHIGSSVTINAVAPITIGDFAGISSGTKIFTSDDDYSGDYLTGPTVPEESSNLHIAPVEIGDHCVVGANSVILPGTVIEEGAVIGALSLAKGRITSWAIHGGVPAKLIKKRSKKLLEKAAALTQTA